MILEGVVTTLGPDGALNVAAMGPDIVADSDRFVLRPFRTSNTFRNLQASGEGVLHVTDDALLIARAVIRNANSFLSRPATSVRGRILETSGRYLEFRVVEADLTAERATLIARTVASGRQDRDLFGMNRAKFAVVEAAILATRLDFLPAAEVRAEFDRLAVLVAKTGGPDEREGFRILAEFLREHRAAGAVGP